MSAATRLGPRRRLGYGLLALMLAGSALACGRKAPPRPPEDVVPKTITDLNAKNEADGVRLSWSRPSTYADGSRMEDLGGFFVERAASTDLHPAFARLDMLEVNDRERFRQIKKFLYVDKTAELGRTYRYRVVSFTTDRYVSEPSNEITVVRSNPAEEKHASLRTP